MKKMCFFCILGATAAALAVYVYVEMGRAPSEKELAKFEKLEYFSSGHFHCIERELSPKRERELGSEVMIEKMPDDGVLLKRRERLWALLTNFVLPGNERSPKTELPEVKLTKKSFPDTPENFAFYWLGHNSTILEISGKRIGIDLVFDNASPVPFTVRRYRKAPLAREDLPDLDYILITHNHYDHLERATVVSIKKGHFIVPLGLGTTLRSWGISSDRITELGWGDTFEKDGLKVTAVESIHFSGRSFFDGNKTLWCSYVIDSSDARVFWGCDGGYGSHFAEIGKKYGPFDMCALEMDAWNAGWPHIHMFPPQMVQAAEDLQAKNVFPMHWGTYTLGFHHWRKSIDKVVECAAKKSFHLLTPKAGEKCVPGVTETVKWWSEEH